MFVQYSRSRRAAALIPVLTAAAAMLLVFSFCDNASKKTEDAAMIVNGTVVTHSELDELVDMYRFRRQIFPDRIFEDESGLKRGAAREMASTILMLEDVKARKWEISPEVMDSIIENVIVRIGGREAFKESLEKTGETETSVRKGIADRILIDSIMVVRSTVDPVSEDEAREHYEANKARYTTPGKVRASHILIAFDPNDQSPDQTESMMRKANEALTKVRAGTDFDQLVREYSSETNGDLGWLDSGPNALSDLGNALATLKKGEVSGLVPSAAGLHIIKKTDEEESRQLEFDEVNRRVRQMLEMVRREAAVNNYIDSLLAAAKITFVDTTLDFTSLRASSAPAQSD